MRPYITLGPCPADEDCAEVGTAGYEIRARAEGERYIALIRKVMGPEPQGARLRVREFPHDLGTYQEVVVEYDEGNETAERYAYRCENERPTKWGTP